MVLKISKLSLHNNALTIFKYLLCTNENINCIFVTPKLCTYTVFV